MAGRPSFTTTDVHPWHLGNQRLRPPEHLGEIERKAFVDLIARTPQAQFVEADVPLLTRWCELELQAQTAAAELRTHGMLTPAGERSPWLAIHAAAVKGQAMLALRLRLGPQSRASKAPKSLPAKMSYYERMDLLDDSDEDEPPH
jgi:phage terminase small subunit